jgi:hypothetical protein
MPNPNGINSIYMVRHDTAFQSRIKIIPLVSKIFKLLEAYDFPVNLYLSFKYYVMGVEELFSKYCIVEGITLDFLEEKSY